MDDTFARHHPYLHVDDKQLLCICRCIISGMFYGVDDIFHTAGSWAGQPSGSFTRAKLGADGTMTCKHKPTLKGISYGHKLLYEGTNCRFCHRKIAVAKEGAYYIVGCATTLSMAIGPSVIRVILNCLGVFLATWWYYLLWLFVLAIVYPAIIYFCFDYKLIKDDSYRRYDTEY